MVGGGVDLGKVGVNETNDLKEKPDTRGTMAPFLVAR